MNSIPFETIDWADVETTIHKGTSGVAHWQTKQYGELRIRIVNYSAGYVADHWCEKGHVVHCLEGEFTSEMEDGEKYVLTAGMSYVVSDNASSHKSVTAHGAKLLIVDGGFLAGNKNVE